MALAEFAIGLMRKMGKISKNARAHKILNKPIKCVKEIDDVPSMYICISNSTRSENAKLKFVHLQGWFLLLSHSNQCHHHHHQALSTFKAKLSWCKHQSGTYKCSMLYLDDRLTFWSFHFNANVFLGPNLHNAKCQQTISTSRFLLYSLFVFSFAISTERKFPF